jgi:hypothetical protein
LLRQWKVEVGVERRTPRVWNGRDQVPCVAELVFDVRWGAPISS